MRPHKILVTGTFESGKTELINLYSNDPRVTLISEVARDVLAFDPSLQSKPEFQNILFCEQLKREKLAESNGRPIILCDRGTLDIIAFSLALGLPVKDEWISNSFGRYRSIVICDPRDVPFRSSIDELNDVSFRDQIDLKIRNVIREIIANDITRPRIIESHGTLVERKQFLDEFIEASVSQQEGKIQRPEQYL
ncbi:MAG TPA: ATP/GTP-binding protein [Candidatus Wunengus sp. YC60]|uniref:ATP/GTP-binding protein n=1 Tax=Candidatus Wunengus sp. YC60 TaxID=3367697 RepID=UPI0040254616